VLGYTLVEVHILEYTGEGTEVDIVVDIAVEEVDAEASEYLHMGDLDIAVKEVLSYTSE
jgi:hypothetical protein